MHGLPVCAPKHFAGKLGVENRRTSLVGVMSTPPRGTMMQNLEVKTPGHLQYCGWTKSYTS